MLASQLPDGGIVLSGSAEVFEGARAALVYADGLFRLDAVVVPDSLRMLVRNATGLALTFKPDGYPRPVVVQGDVEGGPLPGHHQITFTLGDPDASGAVRVDATIATLRFPDRGLVRLTAQAVVRRAEASAA